MRIDEDNCDNINMLKAEIKRLRRVIDVHVEFRDTSKDKLIAALKRAISNIESECDDQELILELKTTLKEYGHE